MQVAWRMLVIATAMGLGLGGCTPIEGPDEDELAREIERTLQDVVGPWLFVGLYPETVQGEFNVGRSTTQLNGTGIIRSTSSEPPTSFAVSGTFVRPHISLRFTGMTWLGQPAEATFAGTYDDFVGIIDTLRITGAGYSRKIVVLVQERP